MANAFWMPSCPRFWSMSSHAARGCWSVRCCRIRTSISSPWLALLELGLRLKMTVKHSRKMAQGSVFYLCSARHSRVEQGAAAGVRSECSARHRHGHNRLRGVPCHRRALEGRRILPPVQCRSTGSRWRERPPPARGSSPQARPEGSFTPPLPPASARRTWTRMHRCSGCHLRVHCAAHAPPKLP